MSKVLVLLFSPSPFFDSPDHPDHNFDSLVLPPVRACSPTIPEFPAMLLTHFFNSFIIFCSKGICFFYTQNVLRPKHLILNFPTFVFFALSFGKLPYDPPPLSQLETRNSIHRWWSYSNSIFLFSFFLCMSFLTKFYPCAARLSCVSSSLLIFQIYHNIFPQLFHSLARTGSSPNRFYHLVRSLFLMLFIVLIFDQLSFELYH